MERVRLYVETCQRHGWRPVFTREQFDAIARRSFPDPVGSWGPQLPVSSWRIYGVEFTIDDTPRPPMPSEEELLAIEAQERRDFVDKGRYGMTQTEWGTMRDLATCNPAWPEEMFPKART
jgi:hypothetical protein